MGMMEVRTEHRGGGVSRTKQSDAAMTDINAIMKRYVAHGVIPPTAGRRPRYGDFTGATSFHEALGRVMEAEREFAALPAAVRDLCDNDPGKFLEMLQVDELREDLLEAGLDPLRVPVLEPVAPEPGASGAGSEPGVSPPAS